MAGIFSTHTSAAAPRANNGLTHTATSASLGAGAMKAAAAEASTLTEDQIADTLAHWDVAAHGQRVFVARIKHDRTQGGIFIPEQWQEQQNDGVVISAGPLAYVNDRQPADAADAERRLSLHPEELDCATRRFLRPGDRITFSRWGGDTVTRKGTVTKGLDTLMVMNADDVIGTPGAR